ncbi:MAG: protein-glutamate O-methyltransferase CheR [Syntrophomonadaceae bacterium]|nr:protein-glutamate O-methyltransferase CheR [Syntrophomonadaceae bacterium]
MLDKYGWEWFVKKAYQKYGIDLSSYKRPQMERRINSFMRTVGASDYSDLIKMCNEDQEIRCSFIEHLTINVSDFFRNPNCWEILQRDIIPGLIKERTPIKIWSAGCSTGEEPYSLALLMREYFPQQMVNIMATDIDDAALSKAQIGNYSCKAVQGVPPHLLKKYFTEDESGFTIDEKIKKMVKYNKQNMLEDRFLSDFDLILCRNVIIYFTEEAKEKLYNKFAQALRLEGVLFIGSTEQIFQAIEIGLKLKSTYFNHKR